MKREADSFDTGQLLRLFNSISGKAPVERFSDRDTAVRRTANLVRELGGHLEADENDDPIFVSDVDMGDTSEDMTPERAAEEAATAAAARTEREARILSESPPVAEKYPAPAPAKRRRSPSLSDSDVLRPTGDYSRIGKGIHTTITNAFDGKKPIGQVRSELVKTLDPPRAKGWQEDPDRYVMEYIIYNTAQGALERV